MQSILNLSRLFYKLANSYNKILETIKEKSKENTKPFDYLFNDGNRIYLPFIKSSSPDLSDEDKKVIDVLKHYKFTDIDYLKGYATSPDGRKFKISSALSRIENKLIKNPDNKDKIDKIKLFFKKLSDDFSFSNNRKLTKYDDLTVVISQDPIDIATMSTGRSWTSCMDLKKQKSFSEERLACEVATGGMVAYLIKSSDIDIKKPLARVWIRRFVNANGESYAVPESKIYGNATKDFYDFVKKWLDDNQIYIEGELSLEGSSWTDTFNSRDYFNIPGNLSEEQFLKLDFKRQLDTNVLLKIINNSEKYSLSFMKNEILPKFITYMDNLRKYPKQYYYLFKLLSPSDDLYNKFLNNSTLDFLQRYKDIKEVQYIYDKIIKDSLPKIENKQKSYIDNIIIEAKKEGLSNVTDIDYAIFSASVLQLLEVCSENTFNEIQTYIDFAKKITSLSNYYIFIRKIFEIMIKRDIVNFKLLSILKNDLIWLFEHNKETKLFIEAFEKYPQKFKFMKPYIQDAVKYLDSISSTINSVYNHQFKKILENM